MAVDAVRHTSKDTLREQFLNDLNSLRNYVQMIKDPSVKNLKFCRREMTRIRNRLDDGIKWLEAR